MRALSLFRLSLWKCANNQFTFNEVKKMAKESLEERKRIGNKDREADSCTIIGVICGQKGDKFSAYRWLNKGNKIYKRIESEYGQKIVLNCKERIRDKETKKIKQLNFI